MKIALALIVAATFFCFGMMVFSMPSHASECQRLDAFVEKQSARFPDLVVTKLVPIKAQLIVEFVNKYAHLQLHGDVVIVGTYTNQEKNSRVGYAIFDAGCMVYGEAISAEEWLSVQPFIFGKNL